MHRIISFLIFLSLGVVAGKNAYRVTSIETQILWIAMTIIFFGLGICSAVFRFALRKQKTIMISSFVLLSYAFIRKPFDPKYVVNIWDFLFFVAGLGIVYIYAKYSHIIGDNIALCLNRFRFYRNSLSFIRKYFSCIYFGFGATILLVLSIYCYYKLFLNMKMSYFEYAGLFTFPLFLIGAVYMFIKTRNMIDND